MMPTNVNNQSEVVHECLRIAAGGEKGLGRLLEKTKLTERALLEQIAHAISKRSFETPGPVPYETMLTMAAQDISSAYH